MTRYERIKKMSIEEMAKSFNKNGIMTDEICREMSKCPYMDEYGDISDDANCTGCIKAWLEGEPDKE